MSEQPVQSVQSELPLEPTPDVLIGIKRRTIIFLSMSLVWTIVVIICGLSLTFNVPEEYYGWFFIGFLILVGGLGCLYFGYILKIPLSSKSKKLNSQSIPMSRRRRILILLSVSAIWLIVAAAFGLLIVIVRFPEMTMEDFYWFLSGFIVIVGGLGCLFLGYVLKIIQISTLKTISLGFTFGLIALLILSVVFWIVWNIVMYFNLPIENIYLYAGLALLLIAIAFGATSFEFLRRAVPKTTIHTFGRLPEKVISREGTKSGIQNQTAVKIIVAEISCILVYLVTLIVFCLTSVFVPDYLYPGLSAGLSIAVPLIGFLLGLVLAVLVFRRTSTS